MGLNLNQSQGQVFGPAGKNHAPGLVPDPGSVALNPVQFLGSDAAFHSVLTAIGTVGVGSGGTGQVSLASHAVLVGEGTSAIQTVGPAAAGLALLANGLSADPSFGNLPFQLLNTLAVTGGASAALSDTIAIANTSYTNFLIVGQNLIPTANSAALLRTSANAGTTYAATGYLSNVFGSNNSANAGANSTIGVALDVSSVSSVAPFGISFAAMCFQPSANVVTQFAGVSDYQNNAGPNEIAFFGGYFATQQVTNAVEFLFPGTTIKSGTLKIYGLA